MSEPRLERPRVGGLDKRLDLVADGPLPLEVGVPRRLPLRREPDVAPRRLGGVDGGPLVGVGRRLVRLRLPQAVRQARRRPRWWWDRVALRVPTLNVRL